MLNTSIREKQGIKFAKDGTTIQAQLVSRVLATCIIDDAQDSTCTPYSVTCLSRRDDRGSRLLPACSSDQPNRVRAIGKYIDEIFINFGERLDLNFESACQHGSDGVKLTRSVAFHQAALLQGVHRPLRGYKRWPQRFRDSRILSSFSSSIIGRHSVAFCCDLPAILPL